MSSEHIARLAEELETDYDHSVSCARWAAFLLKHFPNEYANHSPPHYPTPCAPGSAAKIEVMRQRVAANLAPCHPLDAGEIPVYVARNLRVLRNGRIVQEQLRMLLSEYVPKVQEPLITEPITSVKASLKGSLDTMKPRKEKSK